MSKKQKLSHSSVRLYTTCARKYKLHYINRIRPRHTSGALLFGSALDKAPNHLLETRNIQETYAMFDKCFKFTDINGEVTYIPESDKVLYAESDFDMDLITEDDIIEYETLRAKVNIGGETAMSKEMAYFQYQKATSGINSLSAAERKLYALGNWLCLRRKGHFMIRDYNSKIMPKIKKVLAVQKKVSITNDTGDELAGFLDLAVEWADGKRYVLDNKTSSRRYEADEPLRSQQLILYYHLEKEELNLNGAGFIVLYKQLEKNKVKICSKCQFDGSGRSHKTCNNEVDGVRCKGEWKITISPSVRMDVLLTEIPEAAENLVLETFDQANEAIKQEHFNPNLSACKQGSLVCDYFDYCWRGNKRDLVELGEKK